MRPTWATFLPRSSRAEADAHAAHFLEAEGVTRLDVLNYVSHGIQKEFDGATTGPGSDDGPEHGRDRGRRARRRP